MKLQTTESRRDLEKRLCAALGLPMEQVSSIHVTVDADDPITRVRVEVWEPFDEPIPWEELLKGAEVQVIVQRFPDPTPPAPKFIFHTDELPQDEDGRYVFPEDLHLKSGETILIQGISRK